METRSLALSINREFALPISPAFPKSICDPLTDEEVIARVMDGDIEAFGILVKKYENFVFTLARGLVLADEPARDIAQEAFLRAYRALRRFEKKSSFKTWLYRIAYNTALNYIKKYKDVCVPAAAEPVAFDYSEDIPLRITLRKLIDRLRPEHRAIIMLHYYDDLKYEEIADVLGCPVGTVKIRLFRARNELKLLWGKYAV
jgi:RNA polymerase sigma-70 factor (ECF subfamily)